MRKVILTATFIVALATGLQASTEDLTAKLAAETNCENVASLVSGALDAKSSTTVVGAVLEAALKAKGACACEIVTGAIEATGASAKDKTEMIETIVGTSITTLPAETASITECAVAAAANHSATIEKVLTNTFADNDKEFLGEGGYGKGYGKDGSGRFYVVMRGSVADVDDAKSEAMLERLQTLSGDSGLTLVKIHSGSVVFEVLGTDAAFNRLRSLLEQGQLGNVEGFQVTKVLRVWPETGDDDFTSFAAPLPAPVYLISPSGGVVSPGVLAPLSPSNATAN